MPRYTVKYDHGTYGGEHEVNATTPTEAIEKTKRWVRETPQPWEQESE